MKAHPIADLFPMMSSEEHASLVADMRANGFSSEHAIITLDGQILDGRNRHRAAQDAGVEPCFRQWEGADPWQYVWRENAVRRHLEASQKCAIAVEFLRGSDAWIAAQVEAKARANQARSVTQKDLSKERVVSRDTTRSFGESPSFERNRIAAVAGVSSATAGRVLSVQKDAEQFERVKRGELSATKALGEIKLTAKRALAETIRANPIVTPDGRYQVIVSDPPWKYDARAEDVSHRGKNQYPDMTTEEICALPVGELAQGDCVLWLWTTNAFMRDAYRCLDAWGFKEKTILTWDKEKLGLGDWLRNVTEHCVLAVKGKPVVSLTNQTTMLRAPRREHSRKPDEFYALVEKLCPGSKLEMFSRSPRDGWSAWGAETEKFGQAVQDREILA